MPWKASATSIGDAHNDKRTRDRTIPPKLLLLTAPLLRLDAPNERPAAVDRHLVPIDILSRRGVERVVVGLREHHLVAAVVEPDLDFARAARGRNGAGSERKLN